MPSRRRGSRGIPTRSIGFQLRFLGIEPTLDVLGSRPGEAVQCVHAVETPGGCGTTEFCQTCGAVQAILAAQRGNPDTKECRIATRDSWSALDLKVSTTPFEYEGEQFTVCALQDISHEKRRQTLERTFFHDVLNTAGGLRGYVELLLESDPDEVPEVATTVSKISQRLIEEIETQVRRECAALERLPRGPVREIAPVVVVPEDPPPLDTPLRHPPGVGSTLRSALSLALGRRSQRSEATEGDEAHGQYAPDHRRRDRHRPGTG